MTRRALGRQSGRQRGKPKNADFIKSETELFDTVSSQRREAYGRGRKADDMA